MTGNRHEPTWLDSKFALAVHDRQLSEHGGITGVRDAGLLESALIRPVNCWSYGEDDLLVLAAAYGFGLARNYPFLDGNKRTVWVVARSFLRSNGVTIGFRQEDAIATVQALTAGELEEEKLADWFRQHLAKPG